MTIAVDERLMALALRVARHGDPSPNPHVGAVVARGDRVIAKGFHPVAGGLHAEVVALSRAGRRARGCSVYVTLEPCNHFGRTPPCTDALIEAGVARVVIGCSDPTPHVTGSVRKLRRAGIEVVTGVREKEATELIADFAKHFSTGLPLVTLKAAVSLDGRTATRAGDSRWITNEASRREVHRMRSRSDAVLVGIETALADDPELTVRHVRGRNPLRVVLDRRLRLPPSCRLVRADPRRPVVVYHGPGAPAARRRRLVEAGVELVEVPAQDGRLRLDRVLRALGDRGVLRLLVEGGSTIHGAFLREKLADRIAVFIAPVLLGDPRAKPLAAMGELASIAGATRLIEPRVRRFGADVLIEGRLPRA
jgi:diaminohydroxyphosphoribosylaminopyrimidine deaminase/5-amino-6-(5-phosphoribosylamino)uracil reductase